MTITFNPDGTASCLHGDDFPLQRLGLLSVRRVTAIEFDTGTQCWEVRRLDDDGKPHSQPLFSHADRSACVRWERNNLTEDDL